MCDCSFPESVERARQKTSINRKSYNRWKCMVRRCHLPSDKDFHNYGARGIRVCKQWQESFEQYFKDVGLPPEGMSLDREKNDKGYCPHNVRWANGTEQNLNRRPPKKKSRLPLGIAYRAPSDDYVAQIRIAGQLYYLGRSKDLSEATRLFRVFYFEWFGKLPSP